MLTTTIRCIILLSLSQIFNELLSSSSKSSTHGNRKCSLIQKVDQWEQESIDKIKQIAEQSRQTLINYTNKFIIQIENKLNHMENQFKQIRQENEFNEIDLNQFKFNLNKLKEELEKPSNISIQQDSSTFINKISIILHFDEDTKWKQEGIIRVGRNGRGNQLNQLSGPQCIFIDDDQTIYIADCCNYRMVEWKRKCKSNESIK